MKGKWIQLVAVRLGDEDACLFRAPVASCHPGDEVRVMTRYGQARGRVLMVQDTESRDMVDEIVEAFGAAWPLSPVVSKMMHQDLVFGQDDWREEDDIKKE